MQFGQKRSNEDKTLPRGTFRLFEANVSSDVNHCTKGRYKKIIKKINTHFIRHTYIQAPCILRCNCFYLHTDGRAVGGDGGDGGDEGGGVGREWEGMGGGGGVGGGGRSAALVNDEHTRLKASFLLANYSAETVVFSVNSGSQGVHY